MARQTEISFAIKQSAFYKVGEEKREFAYLCSGPSRTCWDRPCRGPWWPAAGSENQYLCVRGGAAEAGAAENCCLMGLSGVRDRPALIAAAHATRSKCKC